MRAGPAPGSSRPGAQRPGVRCRVSRVGPRLCVPAGLSVTLGRLCLHPENAGDTSRTLGAPRGGCPHEFRYTCAPPPRRTRPPRTLGKESAGPPVPAGQLQGPGRTQPTISSVMLSLGGSGNHDAPQILHGSRREACCAPQPRCPGPRGHLPPSLPGGHLHCTVRALDPRS